QNVRKGEEAQAQWWAQPACQRILTPHQSVQERIHGCRRYFDFVSLLVCALHMPPCYTALCPRRRYQQRPPITEKRHLQIRPRNDVTQTGRDVTTLVLIDHIVFRPEPRKRWHIDDDPTAGC